MCLYTDVSGQSISEGCECLPAFTVRTLCGLPAPVFVRMLCSFVSQPHSVCACAPVGPLGGSLCLAGYRWLVRVPLQLG